MKHRHSGWFDLVVGGRPAELSHPEPSSWPRGDTPAGPAIPALTPVAREALRRIVDRHGTPAAGGGAGVLLPAGIQVRVDYLERSPTGRLREAVARDLRPALPR